MPRPRSGLASLLTCGALALSGQPALLPSLQAHAGMPPVNLAAFRGQGHLAFLWHGRPYVLDGLQSALHALPGGGAIYNLSWSPDGQWLAYLAASSPTGARSLWVVYRDGTRAHHIPGLPGGIDSFSWLPSGAALSVGISGTNGSSTLWLASPGAVIRKATIPDSAGPGTWSGLWSPDGTRIAYTRTLPSQDPTLRSDALYMAPASGAPGVRLVLAPHARIVLLDWWPDSKGLLYFIDPWHSLSAYVFGLPLYSVPLGGTPHLLGTSFTYDGAFSVSGYQVLLANGGARQKGDGKSLIICAVTTGSCRVVPGQPGYIVLEPAWTAGGSRIAFVRARTPAGIPDFPHFPDAASLRTWELSRTLWVESSTGAGAHQLPAAGTAVYQPRWSADGMHLLYQRNAAFWLIDVNGGAPIRVLGPLPLNAGESIAWNRS